MKACVRVLLGVVLMTCCACVAAQLKDGSMYLFSEADLSGQQIRTLKVSFTEEKGRACIGEDWKRAQVVSDPGKYMKEPVYKLENGKLEVLLVNGFCDAYDSYIGQISNGAFEGEHVQYGWGSTSIGKVKGSPVRQ